VSYLRYLELSLLGIRSMAMERKRFLTLICAALAVVFLANGPLGPGTFAQAQVRTMGITGQIAKADHGYIIRGRKPAEIFTILNPDAGILDGLVSSGKEVVIQVRVVSVDNVNIEAIDGEPYSLEGRDQKAAADLTVREMTLQGEIVKVPTGYVVRGTDKSVIFTVLNPEPAVLDKLAEGRKTVEVKVHIVSGDNVNIENIDGKPYPRKDPSTREMTLKGEIVKVPTGYVVRGTDKSVIFTVLNPEPAVLEKLVGAGKEVEVKVGIVSGDNVNIERINGEAYPPPKGGK
jgi:hypothetical protein